MLCCGARCRQFAWLRGSDQRVRAADSAERRTSLRFRRAGRGCGQDDQYIFAFGESLIQNIGGIIPPLVTPFRHDGSIDEEAHRAEVRYMVETAKVHGLAVCGSTGEGHTLTTDETRRIVAWTVD